MKLDTTTIERFENCLATPCEQLEVNNRAAVCGITIADPDNNPAQEESTGYSLYEQATGGYDAYEKFTMSGRDLFLGMLFAVPACALFFACVWIIAAVFHLGGGR